MITLRRLEPDDLARIDPQPAQEEARPNLTPEVARLLIEAGPAWVACAEGRPIAAAGAICTMGDLPIAWAVLSEAAGRHMLAITRIVQTILPGLGRVETGVFSDFPAGRRWARMLGFVPTGRAVDRWQAPPELEVWTRGG
jgi:hypothetical protein